MTQDLPEESGTVTASRFRPQAVAFDVNETLFGLEPIRRRLVDLGLAPNALEWWFAATLRDGFALAASGGDGRFAVLASGALDEVLAESGEIASDDRRREVISALAELDAHVDVEPALRRLLSSNIPAIALTNGGASNLARLVERAGLTDLFAGLISVESIGRWKPLPDAYLAAAASVGVEPGRLALVAVHPWDLHGAAEAGLVTGWPNRNGRRFPGSFLKPAVEAPDLDELVRSLLELPEP